MLQNVHQISKVCKLYKIHIRLHHSYLKFQFSTILLKLVQRFMNYMKMQFFLHKEGFCLVSYKKKGKKILHLSKRTNNIVA